MFKHFYRLLVVFIFTFIGYGQSEKLRTLDSLESRYLKGLNNAPADTTLQRIHRFINRVNNLQVKDSIYIVKTEIAVSNLILLHGRSGQSDSASYYYNQAMKTFTTKEQIADAHRIRALVEFFDLHIDQALYYYDQALEEASSFETDEFKTVILLDLCLFYRYAEEFESAQQIIDELKQGISDSTPPSHLFRIQYEDFYLKTEEEKYSEALEVLKQIDITGILHNSILFRGYHEAFVDAYINLKQYDSALYHNNIAVNSPKSVASFSPIDDYTYYANIYHKKGEYTTALSYLNSIEDTSAVNNSNYSLKDFHEWSYKIHKSLGNEALALKNYERFHEIKSVFDEELKLKQAGILKYKLNKDKALNALKIKQAKAEIKQKQNLFVLIILFIIAVVIFLIIFFIYRRKQEQKQAQLIQNTKLNKVRNQYLESITHEFKTPISVNIGYLELIKSNVLNPAKATDFIEKLQKTQHKLLSNINEFLNFIKLENQSNIYAQQNESLNLYDFIVDKLQDFEPFCISKGITLHFESNISRNQYFSFDYSKLEKVINNLVDNAIKFSNNNQAIYVSCTVNTASLSIAVKDEGIGMAEDQQDKIFSRFYQTRQGKSLEGFGIGLYLVKEFVNTWGGNISLRSALNKGSTFTIDIPYDQEKLASLKSEQQKIVLFDDEKDKANQTSYSILVVEDQYDMADYIKDLLSNHYNCDYAYNAKEALEKISQHDYQLIISDYKMPYMSGIEFKELLDKEEKTAEIPFILISASHIQEDISNLVKRKHVVYLEKPFNGKTLIDLISDFIGKTVNKNKIVSSGEYKSQNNDTAINAFINKTNAFIIENLKNENLKVEDIAKDLGLSQNQFSRQIQEYTGQTASKIIVEIKLLKAYEYIKASKFKTINELMYNVGFSNRFYFYKKFYERFGVKVGDMFKAYKK